MDLRGTQPTQQPPRPLTTPYICLSSDCYKAAVTGGAFKVCTLDLEPFSVRS